MSHLKEAFEKLSANNIENGLPGREDHHEGVYNFIYERLKIRKTTAAKSANVESGLVADIKGRHMNKTMFVCGVPGSGKTVTVQAAVQNLHKLLSQKPRPIHPFRYVYVNGQHLLSPERLYNEILYRVTGETCSSELAQEKLDKLFYDTNEKPSKKKEKLLYNIIVIDEVDLLYKETKKNVLYSLFDWPTTADSKVVLIVIANAMDIAERLMRGRIASRFGWNKLVFEAYNSSCLETILRSRLGTSLLNKSFHKTAITVATVRIGRTTGDARRILDTCRLAIDKAIKDGVSQVTPAIVDAVGFQNYDLQRRSYISNCDLFELYTLKSILKQTDKVGEENVDAYGVYRELNHMLTKHQYFKDQIVGYGKFSSVLDGLAGRGLIYLEGDKPLPKKRLYIKDSSQIFKDLIINQKFEL